MSLLLGLGNTFLELRVLSKTLLVWATTFLELGVLSKAPTFLSTMAISL